MHSHIVKAYQRFNGPILMPGSIVPAVQSLAAVQSSRFKAFNVILRTVGGVANVQSLHSVQNIREKKTDRLP
jgi:hypothetical protein